MKQSAFFFCLLLLNPFIFAHARNNKATQIDHIEATDTEANIPTTLLTDEDEQNSTAVPIRIYPFAFFSLAREQLARDKNKSKFDARSGLGGGATIEIGKNHILFESGLLLRQVFNNRIGPVDAGLSYLSIPLLAKYDFNGIYAASSFFVHAGLLPSYLLTGGKYEPHAEKSSPNYSRRFDTGAIRRWDLPYILGFGGRLRLSDTISLQMGVDYIRSTSSIVTDTNRDIRNYGLYVSGGLSFLL